jgi:hypothetical protein
VVAHLLAGRESAAQFEPRAPPGLLGREAGGLEVGSGLVEPVLDLGVEFPVGLAAVEEHAEAAAELAPEGRG